MRKKIQPTILAHQPKTTIRKCRGIAPNIILLLPQLLALLLADLLLNKLKCEYDFFHRFCVKNPKNEKKNFVCVYTILFVFLFVVFSLIKYKVFKTECIFLLPVTPPPFAIIIFLVFQLLRIRPHFEVF